MIYRNIKELIKPLAQKDPDLHEALKRLDETADKLVAFCNAPTFATVKITEGIDFGERNQLPIVSACRQGARVFCSIATNAASGSTTTVQYDNVRYDTDGMFDAAQPTRLTCKTAGIYLLGGNVTFEADADGERLVRVIVNNLTVVNSVMLPPAKNTVTVLNVSSLFYLNQNDYIEMQVFHNSTTLDPIPILASPAVSPEFWAQKVG